MMTPSWISALANHLWQSTVFAIAIGVVAAAFRRYQARVRYALWFAASVKFFVPLSLLIGLGTQLAHVSPSAPAPSPILSTLVRQISVPFDDAIGLRSPADSGMGVAIVAAQESATQSRPSAPASPTFEVASVKQNTSGDGRVQMQMLPGNRINMTNVPARFLVAQAYQLQQFQLIGGPSWLTTDHYDIVAKLEGEPKPIVPGTPNPAMLALRTLLADRFKLKLHKETRDMDIYVLVMVKQGVLGPGLKPSAIDCVAQSNARRGGPPPGPPPALPGPNDPFPCGMGLMPGMVRMGGMPIGQLTQMLTGQAGRLVFDRTGLTGNWDLTLRFALEQGGGPPPPAGVNVPPVDPDVPSLFTALQEQLGLKLQSTKAPVDVTVIDSIEHPTDD
jgi:uncharacterized protein (TIGR03435 family)